MIVSGALTRKTPRWSYALVLVCAAAVLPLGCATRDSVELANSEREGTAESRADDHLQRLGVTEETTVKIKESLTAAGISGEHMDTALGCMVRLAYAIHGGDDDARGSTSAVTDYMKTEAGFNDEQVELVEGLARRVAHGMQERDEGDTRQPQRRTVEDHFREMGVDDSTMAGTKRALKDAGVSDEQMQPTLGGMLRLAHAVKAQGDEFEMDERMSDYLKREVRLTDAQMRTVIALAHRLSMTMPDRDER